MIKTTKEAQKLVNEKIEANNELTGALTKL